MVRVVRTTPRARLRVLPRYVDECRRTTEPVSLTNHVQQRAAAKNKPGGKLSTSLAAQKKQTQNQTLNAGSEQERMARTADANAETRNWN